MEPRHQVSRAAIDLIKRFEGLRRDAAQLDDGGWTIGYGHTRTARPGARVDEADAEALLLFDLIAIAHAVNEWTYAPLNQHQFDAVVSFAFNIGLENFQRSLTLRRLNEGRMMEAALAMELWRRADVQGERIVVDALVRRRAWEKTLFLKPVDAWAPAPSPVVRPKLDYDAVGAMPSRAPSIVTTRMDGDRAMAEPHPGPSHTPAAPADEATASEAAATSITARLDAIAPLSMESSDEECALTAGEDPFPTAPPPTDEATPAASGAANVASAAQPGSAPTHRPDETSADGGPFPLFLLGLAGVGLFIVAVTFGFRSPVHGGAPFAGGLFGWVFGTAGVACFALAAYFLLVRLGEGERPASR
jgi:lysozyme